MNKIRNIIVMLLSFLLFFSSCTEIKKKEKTKFIYEIADSSVIIVGYSGLESEIVIPNELEGLPVTAIAENAFRQMAGLVSVTVPDSVKVMDYAFVSCPDLESVVIGKSVLAMNGAFLDCPKLKNVTGGENAREMSETFMNCTSLESGIIPKGVESAVSVYKGCKKLKSVSISEGVSFLAMTFEGCISLESITLPSSVKSAPNAFKGCESLKSIDGEENITELDNTFNGCKSLSELQLSDDVTKMCGAFIDCSSLTVIDNLPKSVDEYSPSFSGCASLEAVIIPEMPEECSKDYLLSEDISGCSAVKTIDIGASFLVAEEFCKSFSGLSSLEELNMPEDMAKGFIRVGYTYTDKVFEGENSTLQKAVNKYKKASNVRITENYSVIGGVSYNYIYGGEVELFDAEEHASSIEISTFTPSERSYYWCGYPENGNRKKETVGIERTYSFFLRVTGQNDGTLPDTVIINGLGCSVE